jgi:diguanylate cyclase (GGDEF)-like protein
MVNQRLQAELKALASRDSLTGCLNRRAMGQRIEDEHDRFHRYGRPFSVVLVDLDRFKAINDTRGHGVGDQVLVRTAEVLTQTLRTGDAVARWGGEEFLILLPETEGEAAVVLAERLRLAIAGHAFDLGDVVVTFSAGVAGARNDETVEELCARADRALYRAKETRNRVQAAE